MKYTRGSYQIKTWENKSTSHSNEFEAKCEAEVEKKTVQRKSWWS